MAKLELIRGDTFMALFTVTNPSTDEPQPLDGVGTNIRFTVKATIEDTDADALLQLTLGETAETGTAQSGAAQTITLSEDASESDSDYVGLIITITSGTGSGQSKPIASYVGATRLVTVDSAWSTPPDATSVYKIVLGTITVSSAPNNHKARVTIHAGVTRRWVGISAVDIDFQVELAGSPATVLTAWKARIPVVADVSRTIPTSA